MPTSLPHIYEHVQMPVEHIHIPCISNMHVISFSKEKVNLWRNFTLVLFQKTCTTHVAQPVSNHVNLIETDYEIGDWKLSDTIRRNMQER